MKAMLNNAIKGDYIAADSDPSVSLYEKEMSDSSKNIQYLPPWRVIRNFNGNLGGPAKPNLLKKSTNQNWNPQRGDRFKPEKPSVEGCEYFLEQHNLF